MTPPPKCYVYKHVHNTSSVQYIWNDPRASKYNIIVHKQAGNKRLKHYIMYGKQNYCEQSQRHVISSSNNQMTDL